MDGSHQPVQTGAIVVKSRGAKTIIDSRKPARPVNALLKTALDSRTAVDVYQRIRGAPRQSGELPKRTDEKEGQQADEEDDPKAGRNTNRHYPSLGGIIGKRE